MRRMRWADMEPRQRGALLFLISLQFSLAATAITDIVRRPADQIRGPKWAWALASLVSFVGPITYFAVGRRRESPYETLVA